MLYDNIYTYEAYENTWYTYEAKEKLCFISIDKQMKPEEILHIWLILCMSKLYSSLQRCIVNKNRDRCICIFDHTKTYSTYGKIKARRSIQFVISRLRNTFVFLKT